MKKRRIEIPKISFILLTLNDEKGVRRVLESVKIQDYPHELIEVVVVDDGSSDNSVKIAKRYTSKVYVRPRNGLYANWVYALHKVTGEYVYYIEQDIELRGKDFVKKMLKPLILRKNIIASFTREGYPRRDQHWINRFLSYDLIQRDPLYEFLTPSLESTFVKNTLDYIICRFTLENLPPVGRFLYRVKDLKRTSNWNAKYYFDHDFVINNIKCGYELYAYVPEPGIFHYHAKDFRHLLKKRTRNLEIHYFPYYEDTGYKWVDANKKKDVFKLIFWVVYANLFIPATIRGVVRFLKYKDKALLMEPVVTMGITDVLIFKFVTENKGRRIIKKVFKGIFKTT